MTTRLHGICNGSNNGMEDAGGGGIHCSPTALGLEISAPHSPQISEFCLGLGGGKKVLYHPQPDHRRFKIPSFTSRVHTHSPSVPQRPPFSAELWAIRYHLGREQSILCVFPIMHFCIYSQYLWERSDSVVECLIRDRGAAGLSLTRVTALWSLSKTHLS